MREAIREGSKTQTRRVVKFADRSLPPDDRPEHLPALLAPLWGAGRWWVLREPLCRQGVYTAYADDGEQVIMRGTELSPIWLQERDTRMAMYMPADCGRLYLGPIRVHAERLWQISDADERAEGVEAWLRSLGLEGLEDWRATSDESAFAALWDSINRKKAPWEANPWVWVYSWEQVTTERPE